jgi:1-phosphatidylinositol-3-phosphate 5-kinase
MLVRPHSKIVLQEAIKNDSDFLCMSNIMDYSYVQCALVASSIYFSLYRLLLGIDEAQKQIACGLVDTIGV